MLQIAAFLGFESLQMLQTRLAGRGALHTLSLTALPGLGALQAQCFGTFKCCEKTALAGLRLPRSCCLRFAFICLWTNRLETEAPAMLKIGEQGAGGRTRLGVEHIYPKP